MNGRYWLIQGFDGMESLFELKIGAGQISDNKLRALLQALTAKISLSYEEILGAYANRGTRIANSHLDIQKDAIQPSLSCGSNPHVIASLRELNGKVVVHPVLS